MSFILDSGGLTELKGTLGLRGGVRNDGGRTEMSFWFSVSLFSLFHPPRQRQIYRAKCAAGRITIDYSVK